MESYSYFFNKEYAMEKKIMFFTPSLNIGGIERVFITYANSLCHSYKVFYICCNNIGELSTQLDERVEYKSLGNLRLRQSFLLFVNVIKECTPDFLVSGGEIPNSICFLAVKIARTNTKIIISQHNYFNVENNNFINKFIIKFIYNKVDAIISVSDGITKFLEKLGVNKHLISTIYNPINLEFIYKQKNMKLDVSIQDYCLFVGRFSKVKNLYFLIDSFENVVKKLPKLKLLLVGDGEEKSKILDYIRIKKLSNSIIYYGCTDNPYPLIKESRMVLLSSYSEALPTIILESFALGKTVVSTPTLGAIDLIKQGKYGYLTSSMTDINEFANKIITAYNSPIKSNILKEESSFYDIEKKRIELEKLILSL